MSKYTVLSLFDGLSGGQIALERAGVKVKEYYASEVDKYAIQVTQHNYPNTIQLGSVIDLTKQQLKKLFKGKKLILIGGSPCQGFSVAGKMKGSVTKEGIEVTSLEQYLQLKKDGFEFDGQSYLFWEYIRIRKIVKPKYFFLENVRVTKQWLPMFNEAMGVEPIMINSALVSAQNRVRYYWTNIPDLTQPEDRGILLKDILEDNVGDTYNLSEKFLDGCLKHKERHAAKGNGFGFKPKENLDCKSNTLTDPGKNRQSDTYIKIDKSVKPSVAVNIKRDHDKILASDKNFFTMECESGYQDNKVGLKKSPCLRAGNNCTYVLDNGTVTLTDKELIELADREASLTGGKKKKIRKRYLKKYANKILTIPEATKLGYIEVQDGECFDLSVPNSKTRRGRSMKDKSNCLTTSNGFMRYEHPTYRKLTPTECERLQTVPDGYTSIVSNSQRYKMLGNGWNIETIVHLFKGIKK